jgi:hypothetical protein
MNILSKCLLGAALLILASGCATTRYDWNGYDALLYQHYRNPHDMEVFAEKLQKSVLAAEEANKVPPGLYAEYGFLLYEMGSYSDAVGYFQKEKQLWPESHVLMDKMIANASQLSASK